MGFAVILLPVALAQRDENLQSSDHELWKLITGRINTYHS